ncbi:MAG: autotransporter outer membrane beta-barrel domain-containing protein [Gemmatimonadaceae bacterium]
MFGEAGYGFAFRSFAVEPFAGAAWVHLGTDAANDRGGAAALAPRANSFEVGFATLGIRAASMIPLGHDMVLVPRAALAWQHAFSSVTPLAAVAFENTAAAFVVAGVPIARDSLLAEAGLDLAIGRNTPLASPMSASSRAPSKTTPPRGSSATGSSTTLADYSRGCLLTTHRRQYEHC